jgi:heptosyltransferase-2
MQPLANVRRVLVREVNWLGDLVMSLPAVRAVRDAFPRAHLSVMVKGDLAGFFDGAGWIDEVIPFAIAPGLQGWRSRWCLARQLRCRRFDLAVILPRSFDAALLPALAGIPHRAGSISDARGWLLTHKARLVTHDPNEHQANVYLRMLKATLGIEGHLEEQQVDVAPLHLERMQAWLQKHRKRSASPLIALAPAAAYGPAKEWPASDYAALIDDLAARFDAEAVLVGSPAERAKCETVTAASRHGALVAAGDTSIGQAIALLALCDGFAGNDSGSMHVAAALGVPTVGIFGSTNPVRTGPLGPCTAVLYERLDCSPCLERTCRFGHYDCLRKITPDSVVEALQRLGALTVR